MRFFQYTTRRTRMKGWLVAFCSVAAAVSLVGHAQTETAPMVTRVMRTGLHSFYGTPFLTVAEVGALRASSMVSIEFRDDADRVVASTDGVLRRGEPVRLRLPAPSGAPLRQYRATVRISSLVGEGSVPVATFEQVGPGLFLSSVGPSCGPGAYAGGGQTNCQGWVLTSNTGPAPGN